MLRFYPSAIMVAFLTTSLSACSLFGNRPCSNQNDCRIDEACSADGLCFEIRQDAGPTLRDAGPVDVAAVDATLIADVSVNDVFENDANRLARHARR